REKRAVPVLIDVLAKGSRPQAWQAEDLLLRLAGENPPAIPLGSDEASHRKCRDSWLAWLRQNESRVDWSKLAECTRLKGDALVGLLDEGKVMDLGPDNKPHFEISDLQFPLDVQLLPGGNVLVTENRANLITERDPKGEIVWQLTVTAPLMAQRLPNGNTFV